MAKEEGEHARKRAATATAPDHPSKPEDLSDIRKPSWKYVLKKTVREYGTDQATDLAAALTYFGVLAIFPALLAVVSLLGLFGDPSTTTDAMIDLLGGLVPSDTLDGLREPIARLAESRAAGLTFVTGLVGALWSASGYVGAFARAMNRIYGIQEGRPVWRLRPVTLGVTVLALVSAVLAAVVITATGPIARELGEAIGVGSGAVVVWDIAKWPLLAFLAVLIVAVLYYATPNVQQPRFRWMSVGALVALVAWAVVSAGFAFYVANFSSYNETYGSIGGVIVFLLWLWISNNALLFGAELDAELERGRELQAGIAAEEDIQLPPRDTRQSDKKEKQHREDIAEGRRLRGAPAPDPDPESADEESPKDARRRGKKVAKLTRRNLAALMAQRAVNSKPRE